MNLQSLSNALGVMQSSMGMNLHVHHAQMVLFVGTQRSVTYKQVQDHFKISNAAASRSLNSLSDNPRHRKTSYGLVNLYRDPSEGRRYRARLSEKGLALYELLADL